MPLYFILFESHIDESHELGPQQGPQSSADVQTHSTLPHSEQLISFCAFLAIKIT